MSGLFRSTVIKGNRLTDFAQTTATVGVVIPFGYGTFTSDGNVIFAPLPPVEHVTRKRQGKGGVKQETYTYTLSYAVAFAQGPIESYVWIKRNGKVVYTTDPDAPAEDLAYAQKWLQKATLYLGTPDQLPDSTIESYEGSGLVSAFRYLAYIVVEDDDVTEGGGAVPVYEACVRMPGRGYLTTPPYPLLVEEGYTAPTELVRVSEVLFPIEGYDALTEIVSAELRDILQFYTMQDEAYEGQTEVVSGELRDILKYYTIPDEAYEATSTDIVSGELADVRFDYIMQDEGYDCSTSIVSGSLT